MIPLSAKTLSAEQRGLLNLLDRLDEQDRATLMAFAEFLAARAPDPSQAKPDVPLEPKATTRPETESVVAAIRRLSETYYMLQRQDLLNETSALMTAHVLKGRSAADVVDELELVFRSHYDRYLEQWSG